ncbi:hypothetical protein C8J56DRAFT_1051761 [Mycena floridula]|nr:hypothetical protein C8J56DRAFT_1051761 [Mycena floridula]
MTIKNVLLVGVSGALGPAFLTALTTSGKFNITVLSRETSTAIYDPKVKVLKVDYGSQAALVDAMKGQDAAVLAFGVNVEEDAKVQDSLIDAAIVAGVSHIIPSSYITDISKPPGSGRQNQFTVINIGPFFDWGLVVVPFLGIDLTNKRAVLIDGGRVKINHTLVPTVAKAVVAILTKPDVAVNRSALIHDFFVSQRDIVEVAEKELGTKFEIIEVDSDELSRTSWEKLAAGDGLAAAGKPSSAAWNSEDDDTKVLGLMQKDLTAEIIKVIHQLKLKE